MAPARKKQKLSESSARSDEDQIEANEKDNLTTAEAQEAAVQQRRSLFVRSLPANTNSAALTELFSEAFPVKHAVAVTDPATKECRGYGFVTFADADDAAQAKEQFNGHVLDGKKLRVEVAEPRHRNAQTGEPTESKEKAESQHPPKLIVRNLPWSFKKGQQLEKLFQSYGKIKQAYIPRKGPGLLAGFGFVVMRGRKNAEKAIEGINGKEVDGRALAVDWAVDKEAWNNINAEDSKGEDAEREAEDSLSESEESDEESSGFGDEDDKNSDTSDGEREEGDSTVMEDDMEGNQGEESEKQQHSDDTSTTIFVRNLPFTCTDEDLEDHFVQFGSVRYARVVMDHETGRSKGTGFVCFYDEKDAHTCLRNAPIRSTSQAQQKDTKESKAAQPAHSILQNEYADPSGQYTLESRVLQISKAVNKNEANRLTEEGVVHRYKRDSDKRKLFLLSEGTISSKSKLWESLSPSERAMREASAKQRKKLIESNPSLHLSLTRLSIRNIPRSVGSKELKALARDAVVGFASDVKIGTRQKLSREELSRGGEEMQAAERARKKAGKGIVKQAKVVFESAGGSKVSEDTGAGRSRGYGFIEYYTHRNALMGLRWLNGHAVGYQVQDGKNKQSREDAQDRKKRLIVEFAIENAQVVMRRNEMEQKARARSQAIKQGQPMDDGAVSKQPPRSKGKSDNTGSRKRKRGPDVVTKTGAQTGKPNGMKTPVDEKLARRNQIIGKKRAMRKARKDGK